MTQLTYVYLAYCVAAFGFGSLTLWIYLKNKSLKQKMKALSQ